MPTARAYNSPLREERFRETRDAILVALFDLMKEAGAPDEIGMEAIAQRAGVQRRTVFRHFASKDELLVAFWPWLNQRIGASIAPASPRDIADGPRQAFPLFDAHEQVLEVVDRPVARLALAHLLYSASAWEVLKDYGGLDGAQAGETASWALELILSAIGPRETPADATIATKGDRR